MISFLFGALLQACPAPGAGVPAYWAEAAESSYINARAECSVDELARQAGELKGGSTAWRYQTRIVTGRDVPGDLSSGATPSAQVNELARFMGDGVQPETFPFSEGLDTENFSHAEAAEQRILDYLACSCADDDFERVNLRGIENARRTVTELRVFVEFADSEPVIQTFDYAGNINDFSHFLGVRLVPVRSVEMSDLAVVFRTSVESENAQILYDSDQCSVTLEGEAGRVIVSLSARHGAGWDYGQAARCFGRGFTEFLGIQDLFAGELEPVLVDEDNQTIEAGFLLYNGRLVGIPLREELICPLALYRHASAARPIVASYFDYIANAYPDFLNSRSEIQCVHPQMLRSSDFQR